MKIAPNSPMPRRWAYRFGLVLLALALSPFAEAGTPRVKEAKFEDGDNRLVVKVVRAGRRALVTIASAETGDVLKVSRADKEGKLEAKFGVPSGLSVPCSVQVSTEGGTATREVEDAPEDCGSDAPPVVPEEPEEEGDGSAEGSGGSGGGIAEHQSLTYTGPDTWSKTCLECHSNHAMDIYDSTHYQWKGIAPDMLNQTDGLQGKHAGAVNTYCGNILGNWNGCSACHIGLGAEPESVASTAQLENIDCLICHQEGYKRRQIDGIMQPDTSNMAMTMTQAIRTVHKPTRVTCLQCHAKAGGGDALKRGDLALATGNTADKDYDVHMATTGANLVCQDCHVPQNHRFPGKGSDIRPTDLDVVLECASSGCHGSKPHDSGDLNRHTVRVACQTCHIPVFGKDASDTVADEATEIDRSWQSGSHHTTSPLHPVLTKANNLVPVYRHWNRTSDNTLLYDIIFPNPATGTYETSVPVGAVDDEASKLYPFKYKTSDYPMRTASNQLIALDTSIFFATEDGDAAAMSGLENMGFDAGDDFHWVTTDTYQLLNHQVGSHDDALGCNECHMSKARMDLQGELGYAPTNKNKWTCADGCHKAEKAREWSFGNLGEYKEGHKKHREEGVACAKCHAFSR